MTEQKKQTKKKRFFDWITCHLFKQSQNTNANNVLLIRQYVNMSFYAFQDNNLNIAVIKECLEYLPIAHNTNTNLKIMFLRNHYFAFLVQTKYLKLVLVKMKSYRTLLLIFFNKFFLAQSFGPQFFFGECEKERDLQ